MQRAVAVAGGTVAIVGAGLALGVDADNLHNGLLAVSFAAVGAFVLRRRPGQTEARLFLGAGLAQAVVFAGRQVGAHPETLGDGGWVAWLAWLGTWPLPLVVVLVGATIMCFPDGRFAGPGWRAAFRLTLVVGVALAVVSALWPVDYERVGILVDHPLDLPGAATVTSYGDVARPASFAAFQVIWLVAVVARAVRTTTAERRQLRWLLGAVGLSVVVLAVGLAAEGSPRAGLLTLPLIPVAAGIAIIEASYEAMVVEVRSSARRVVTAEDEARRVIERDLHDGAQHRLVVLGMELGRLVDRAERSGDADFAAEAQAARDQLLTATAELRELARGIHPSVLTQDGLASALASLGDLSAVPVHLHVDLDGRPPPEVEATAYFAVSEALTNAARHSGASRVVVEARREGPVLAVVVHDDGVGGARARGGLRGLGDRVTSLGGTLALDSPHGHGTRLEVRLPCP